MLNLKKNQYSKINKYRRTFHITRHRKKGKYIGGIDVIDKSEFEDLNTKSIRLLYEAEEKLKLIKIEYNEASKALKEALYNVGIQEEDDERKTEEDDERKTEEDDESAREKKVAVHKAMKEAQDNVDVAEMDLKRETDQFNQGTSVKERIIASEKNLDDANKSLDIVNKNLDDPMKKLYEAENKFEKADDKLTKANAEVEACKYYKTNKADIHKMSSFQNEDILEYNGRLASNAYHKIYDDFQPVKQDYFNKKKLYEDKIKEIIKEVKPKQTMYSRITSLFDSDKIKQKKALNTYYKNNPESKTTVDKLKSEKKISEMQYYIYNFLIPHLKTDYDNAISLIHIKAKRADEAKNRPGIPIVIYQGPGDGIYEWNRRGGRKKSGNKKNNTKKRHIKRRPKKNKY